MQNVLTRKQPELSPVNEASLASAVVTICPPVQRVPPDPNASLDELERYLEALEAEDLDYVHDPGWTNGGIGSYGAALRTDDEQELRGELPAPNVRGLGAFLVLEKMEGIPELGWHYCASALEIGVFSSFDAQLVQKLMLGGSVPTSGSAPSGPSNDQMNAATLQRSVRGRLGQLSVHLQAVLELAYTDRRYDSPLVSRYGVGLAPLIWRAAQAAGETDKQGRVKEGSGTLRALIADVQHEWPTYGDEEPEAVQRTQEARIRHAAETLLWTAHERYRIEANMQPPSPKPKKRRTREAPHLVSQGAKGRKRRQLIEIPRVAA